MIAAKVKAGGKSQGKAASVARDSAQIINLMDALTSSLKAVGNKKPRRKAG